MSDPPWRRKSYFRGAGKVKMKQQDPSVRLQYGIFAHSRESR